MLEFFNEEYGIIISIFSFLLTVLSVYIVVKNLKVLKDQNETTIKSARDERFKNAIDQLGSDKNAVVLGSIYTLHRIVKEDTTYRENVFNIFCAYIRDTTTTKEYQGKYKYKPSETIQTILNLICVNEKDREVYKGFIVDLQESYLAGCNLKNAHFPEKSNLNRVNFTFANLSDSTLTGIYLIGSILINTNLARVKLIDTYLRKAILINTKLQGADLTNSYLIDTNIINVELWKSILSKTDVSKSTLIAVNLFETMCSEIFLGDTNIIASNLRRIDISNTNLNRLKLTSVYSIGEYFNSNEFEKQINYCVGRESDLSGIKGGYNPENTPLKGEPIFGVLTKEEADKIIADYKKAMKDIENPN